MDSTKPADEGAPAPSERPPRAPHPDFFPFHIVPGVSNFRDIGGWPISFPESSNILPPSTSVSKHVRKGIIYRGSDTNHIKHEGIAKLQELDIKTDFDLRSRQQIEKAGGFKDMSEEGIERVWTPVFAEEQYTEEAARKRYELYASDSTEGIVEAFVEILTEGATMFRIVLTHLLDTVPPLSSNNGDRAPALFMHCTTGNNRTGIFISILLQLLHVPSPVIVHEYTLSEQGLAPTRHINVERLLKKGAFKEHEPEEAKRKCERMVGARSESMQALLEEVQTRWGGAEGYFRKDVGLSDEQIEKLKEVLIAPDLAETNEDEATVAGAQL